ncbi:hypothetical protein M5K25_012672 [Dendrobium thyrsiflorum]|uniref:non-specific serine/threonine protein kinase n=1 Tax=Dendrobium thyrsiflorum TaxID=117978 RepID=A0ABD0UY38_DENTH
MFALFLTFVTVGQALIGFAAKTYAFTEIPVGSSLHLNSPTGPNSWISPSGRFAFGFYPEGKEFSIGINMFVSPTVEPLVIWTAARDQGIKLISKEAVLSFTKQGFLLTPSNGAKTITLIEFNFTESTGASMLDSGNFVIYDSNTSSFTKKYCNLISDQVGSGVNGNSCITWQSFDYPTDTMMGGQILTCGNGLTTRQNNTDQLYYSLTMQCDANLVLYSFKRNITADGNTTTEPSELTPVWASQTWDSWSSNSSFSYTKWILDEDGRLFLSTDDGDKQLYFTQYKPTDSNTKKLYYATLDSNKYFRLFALNLGTNRSTLLYEIPTLNDACQMEFLCGVNSYCVINNSRAECRCLPGFNFTDSRAPYNGCQRSITEPNCWSGASDTTTFLMEQVENLVWYDEAYSIVPVESEDDCSSTCLAECNCEAAVFFNKNCAKHKLPISRAAKGTNFTVGISTAYIKIGKAEENQRSTINLMTVLLFSGINAGVFLALLVAGAGSYWLFYGRYRLLWRKWELAFQEEVAPRSFSFQELAKATNSFASELGRGGHAIVFMGYLTMYGRPNPVPVAVKRLSPEEEKGESDFHAEIRIIGRAHHVNLVRLLGFCYEDSKRLLIYEYMSKGSLANLILQSDPPSWKEQARILFGVARGINYLHRECETKIIHRDIKPENILIDERWRVKISDFGISKLLVEGSLATRTKRTSAPGTSGYVAPECVQSKGENVTEKADVYSFGIVVLETVFWQRNTVDNDLFELARKYCEETEAKWLMKVDLADTELEKAWMLKLGMACVQEEPNERPDMDDSILCKLQGLSAVSSPATAVVQRIIASQKKISWASMVK